MTGKQYQGFIRALKTITENAIEKNEREESTKENAVNDIKIIDRLLQDMLEDGN